MKKTVEISYRCDVCKMDYSTERQALVCERGKTEPRTLFPGDIVKDKIRGGYHHDQRWGPIIGRAKIVNPGPYDEWMIKGLGKYRHIWEYEFKCICKECEKDRRGERPKFFTNSSQLHSRFSSLLELLKKRDKTKTRNRR